LCDSCFDSVRGIPFAAKNKLKKELLFKMKSSIVFEVMRDTIELLKDIVSDMDDKIESGDHSQEAIVDMVIEGLHGEGYDPEKVTTKMGGQAEALVEAAFLSYALDYPPHRVSRNALIKQQTQKPWRKIN
jgi:hypothetical protein